MHNNTEMTRFLVNAFNDCFGNRNLIIIFSNSQLVNNFSDILPRLLNTTKHYCVI